MCCGSDGFETILVRDSWMGPSLGHHLLDSFRPSLVLQQRLHQAPRRVPDQPARSTVAALLRQVHRGCACAIAAAGRRDFGGVHRAVASGYKKGLGDDNASVW